MQAFANVATAPVRRETQGGKIYWEFRAAESAKNEDKEGTTWYTVRVFQKEDPRFAKGDFIRVVGKLKQDVFMSREGKPMGVLVVMCYEAKRFDKPKSGQATAETPSPNLEEAPTQPSAELGKTVSQANAVQRESQPVDESWLALVT